VRIKEDYTMPEETFEMKFGQLAENQLLESVPALVPFKIGFQILDKNDEDTRAIGVLAFIINDVWAFMPVFFLEGKLKGMNTLYLQKHDLFIPARDNWIAVIKEKGANILGNVDRMHEEDKNEAMDETYAPESIDITENENSTFKYASANDVISYNTIEAMFKKKDHEINLNLIDNLQYLDKNAKATFIDALEDASFMNNILKYYESDLDRMLAEHAVEKAAAEDIEEMSQVSVKIVTNMDDPEVKNLKGGEKRALMKNGIYVIDNREEHSKVYQGITQFTLTNPTETGVFELLQVDGTLKNYAVIFLSTTSSINYDDTECVPCGYENTGTKQVGKPCAVIDPSNPNYYYKIQSHKLFGRENKVDTLKDLISKGKKATKINLAQLQQQIKEPYMDGPPSCDFTFVSPTGKAFELKLKGDLVNGEVNTGMFKSFSKEYARIDFTDKNGKLVKWGDTLFIPEDVVVFRKATYEEEREGPRFGDSTTAYTKLLKQASPITIKAYGDTAEVLYDGSTTGLQKRANIVSELVINHGIQAGQVQSMLNTARSASHNSAEFLIKHAAPAGPGYRADEKAKVPHKEDPTPVTTENRQKGAEWNPSGVIEAASLASQSGIKEVFSVEVLKSLASIADVAELRKDWIKDLMKSLDKLGRLLFIYYWYNDDMENKYGEEDMDKLEDSLNAVFLELGDLVLFLKEKSIYTSDISDNIEGTLSEDIGATGEY
jgi:hypothetical protein